MQGRVIPNRRSRGESWAFFLIKIFCILLIEAIIESWLVVCYNNQKLSDHSILQWRYVLYDCESYSISSVW